jgi:wyosine [tRNA(Phe)-imidazoG37] synthetase (radical SAM superfamily)
MILKQVREAIRDRRPIDFLTFSGSGEPTLNSRIGYLIQEIKKITDIPVCVITNGSLLFLPEVRRAIRSADVVLPTLCCASQKTLDRVNRPCPGLKIEKIIKGLTDFRREFSGQIWLEIMLVRGLNDSPQEIRRLKPVIRKIHPDRIQLNTVVRPPSDRSARPVPLPALERIRKMLGKDCEIVAEFGKKRKFAAGDRIEKDILEIIKRRPETASAIARSLGADQDQVHKTLDFLIQKNRIRIVRHQNRAFYEPV